jgi:hypothetical protein
LDRGGSFVERKECAMYARWLGEAQGERYLVCTCGALLFGAKPHEETHHSGLALPLLLHHDAVRRQQALYGAARLLGRKTL